MFDLDHGRYMYFSLSGTKCKCSAMQQQWPHINPAVLIYGLLSSHSEVHAHARCYGSITSVMPSINLQQ